MTDDGNRCEGYVVDPSSTTMLGPELEIRRVPHNKTIRQSSTTYVGSVRDFHLLYCGLPDGQVVVIFVDGCVDGQIGAQVSGGPVVGVHEAVWVDADGVTDQLEADVTRRRRVVRVGGGRRWGGRLGDGCKHRRAGGVGKHCQLKMDTAITFEMDYGILFPCVKPVLCFVPLQINGA